MARLRVFVSSTFYDLKYVRADIERFVKELGYEPVLNERGHIPYGVEENLEEYCYREISQCDILVSIIGSRFGTSSRHEGYSISQQEIRTAHELGKQVYLFVERAVDVEYQTYLKNKAKTDISYASVDDPRVYRFLEEIKGLPSNNAMHPFDSLQDMFNFLQEQWLGLFQRLLQESARKRGEASIVESLRSSAETLRDLVELVAKQSQQSSEQTFSIVMIHHPVFARLAKLTNTAYRIFFVDHKEMTYWLRARQWAPVDESHWDDEDHEEWILATDKKQEVILHIWKGLFDTDGRLKQFDGVNWQEDWIRKTSNSRPPPSRKDDLDDVS